VEEAVKLFIGYLMEESWVYDGNTCNSCGYIGALGLISEAYLK
jgi:hypothetical protein